MKRYYDYRGVHINERPILIIDTEDGYNVATHPAFKGKRVVVDLEELRKTSIMTTKIAITSMQEEEDAMRVLCFEKLQMTI